MAVGALYISKHVKFNPYVFRPRFQILVGLSFFCLNVYFLYRSYVAGCGEAGAKDKEGFPLDRSQMNQRANTEINYSH